MISGPEDAVTGRFAALVVIDRNRRQGASHRAALRILDQRQPVHLLFTDVVMPGGLRGPDLTAEAVQRRPGLKVPFAFAYTDRVATESRGLTLGRLLKKP